MLSRLLSEDELSLYRDDKIDVILEQFRIPVLPKFGVHANMQAMIVSSIVVIIVSIWSNGEITPQSYAATRLIPSFFLGVTCGYLSIIAGLVSLRIVENTQTTTYNNSFVRHIFQSANVLLSASVALMVLSNLIFLASAGYGFFVVFRLFVPD